MAVNLGIKSTASTNNSLSSLTRAGVSYWEYEVKVTDSFNPGEILTSDDRRCAPYYDIRLKYRFSDNIIAGL
jgi:hypothetical protein